MTEAAAERFDVLKATVLEQLVAEFRQVFVFRDKVMSDSAVPLPEDPPHVEDVQWIAKQSNIMSLASLLATRELLPGVYTFDPVEDKHRQDAAALVVASSRLSMAVEGKQSSAASAQAPQATTRSGQVKTSFTAPTTAPAKISFVSPKVGGLVAQPRKSWYKPSP